MRGLLFLRVGWFCAASFIDGKPIVNLPPRIVNLQESEFSLEERLFYSNLEADSRAQFQVSNEQFHGFGYLWSLQLRMSKQCLATDDFVVSGICGVVVCSTTWSGVHEWHMVAKP